MLYFHCLSFCCQSSYHLLSIFLYAILTFTMPTHIYHQVQFSYSSLNAFFCLFYENLALFRNAFFSNHIKLLELRFFSICFFKLLMSKIKLRNLPRINVNCILFSSFASTTTLIMVVVKQFSAYIRCKSLQFVIMYFSLYAS
jgi:hypothetical protein